MPLYRIRNVLEARGIKAFWRIEAGVTRGALPEEEGSQAQSQERIKKLQQELHEARQHITVKNRRLKRLKNRRPRQDEQSARQDRRVKNVPGQASEEQIDPAQFGATLPIPPRDMGVRVQARDIKNYLKVGATIKSKLLHYTGVTPTSSILDIGAGPGRVARHFVDFIEPPGRYVGMDIEKPNMDWCEENISAANPAFNFFHQNVYNGMYNPQGDYRASEYRFPFEEKSFDVIFLTSVFTHLIPEDVQNYLSEISRLLKTDGVCFCTWFLLGHDLGVKYMGPHSREARVGFGFGYVMEMLEEAGLTLAQEPALGSWRGQKTRLENQNSGGQDLLLLKRGSGEGSLPSRYRAPDLPQSRTSEPEEATGTIQIFNPASSSITLQNGEEKTIKVPPEAELSMNGHKIDSAVLRPGQQAAVKFIREGDAGDSIARSVHATDHARPLNDRMSRVSGTLEVLNRDSGLITLIVGNRVRTFGFDPGSVEAYSEGRQISLADLEIGQGVAIEQSEGERRIIALGSLD